MRIRYSLENYQYSLYKFTFKSFLVVLVSYTKWLQLQEVDVSSTNSKSTMNVILIMFVIIVLLVELVSVSVISFTCYGY